MGRGIDWSKIPRRGPGKYELEFLGHKVFLHITFPDRKGFSQEITNKKMYLRVVRLFDLTPMTALDGETFNSLVMDSVFGRM